MISRTLEDKTSERHEWGVAQDLVHASIDESPKKHTHTTGKNGRERNARVSFLRDRASMIEDASSMHPCGCLTSEVMFPGRSEFPSPSIPLASWNAPTSQAKVPKGEVCLISSRWEERRGPGGACCLASLEGSGGVFLLLSFRVYTTLIVMCIKRLHFRAAPSP